MADAKVVIGVDESGRGSLAGPLVVCAVAFLRDDPPPTVTYRALNGDKVLVTKDSKLIKKAEHREMLDQAIRGTAHALSIIERTNTEIDAVLMYHCHAAALKQAISRCIEAVVIRGVYTDPKDFVVLLDGDTPIPPGLPCVVRAIPNGDRDIWQIGAASIVAKVACDKRMLELHDKYPDYNFAQHKGYGTKLHKDLLAKLGPSPAHRMTFMPVQKAKGVTPGFEEY